MPLSLCYHISLGEGCQALLLLDPVPVGRVIADPDPTWWILSDSDSDPDQTIRYCFFLFQVWNVGTENKN